MAVTPVRTQWNHLEQRPHPWRRQLYFKGKKLSAFAVWMDMIVNHTTLEETAENWDLPVGAVSGSD